MNSTIEIIQSQHPPIGQARSGLLDRAAVGFGLALIRWAQRSEQVRIARSALRRERAARHHDYEQVRSDLAAQRARLDQYLLFRALQ